MHNGVMIVGRVCPRLVNVGNGKALYIMCMAAVAVQCTRDCIWRLR